MPNSEKLTNPKPRKRIPKSLQPKLLIAITDRGKAHTVRDLFARSGMVLSSLSMGNGTASSEIMDILGLVNSEKDILLSFVSKLGAKEIMNTLNDRLGGTVGSKGIVMQVSVSASSNAIVKAIEAEGRNLNGDRKVNEQNNYSLIIISVKQGYVDTVMTVAKSAGARGGTVIRALQTANENTEILLGAEFSQEREILAILSPADKRNAIMEEVNAKCGINSDANGFLFSLAVEDIAKLN